MFARIVTTQGKPEKMEEGIRAYREMVLPELKKRKGFKQGYLLINRQTGKSIGISMWESEQAAGDYSAMLSQMYQQVNQRVGMTQEPTVENYEIAVAEMPMTVGMK